MAERTGKKPLPAIAVCLLCLAGCATFKPVPMEEVDFRENLQTQESGGLRVSVAVPDREQAKKIFGVDLWQRKIQPVWLEVENQSRLPYGIVYNVTDPMYFSAHEAAYLSHFSFRSFTNGRMDEHFDSLGIEPDIDPGEKSSGFVFTNKDEGTKNVRVGLFGPHRAQLFEFDIRLPGLKLDWQDVDWHSIYSEEEFVQYTDEEEFAEALRQLPCCTTRKNGSGEGDPINLIFVGSGSQLHSVLTRAGWDETERLTFSTAWRTFKAGVFGGEYRYSPMSSLYLYGRGQDAGFQKARDSIHQRNHLRVWLAPMTFDGELVWIGTITRDIGVYFTTRAWNLTTHAIDPYVDEARGYVTEDVVLSQQVQRFGYVEGVGAATRDEPHRNLMLAPWWTDGHRAVFMFGPEPTDIEEVGFLYWDWPNYEPDSDINDALRELEGQ